MPEQTVSLAHFLHSHSHNNYFTNFHGNRFCLAVEQHDTTINMLISVFILSSYCLVSEASPLQQVSSLTQLGSECELQGYQEFEEQCGTETVTLHSCNPGYKRVWTCLPGTDGLPEGFDPDQDVCDNCPPNTYQKFYNKCTACHPCSLCEEGETIEKPCDSHGDTVCTSSNPVQSTSSPWKEATAPIEVAESSLQPPTAVQSVDKSANRTSETDLPTESPLEPLIASPTFAKEKQYLGGIISLAVLLILVLICWGSRECILRKKLQDRKNRPENIPLNEVTQNGQIRHGGNDDREHEARVPLLGEHPNREAGPSQNLDRPSCDSGHAHNSAPGHSVDGAAGHSSAGAPGHSADSAADGPSNSISDHLPNRTCPLHSDGTPGLQSDGVPSIQSDGTCSHQAGGASVYLPDNASSHSSEGASGQISESPSSNPSDSASDHLLNNTSGHQSDVASSDQLYSASYCPLDSTSCHHPNGASVRPMENTSSHLPNSVSSYSSDGAFGNPSDNASDHPSDSASGPAESPSDHLLNIAPSYQSDGAPGHQSDGVSSIQADGASSHHASSPSGHLNNRASSLSSDGASGQPSESASGNPSASASDHLLDSIPDHQSDCASIQPSESATDNLSGHKSEGASSDRLEGATDHPADGASGHPTDIADVEERRTNTTPVRPGIQADDVVTTQFLQHVAQEMAHVQIKIVCRRLGLQETDIENIEDLKHKDEQGFQFLKKLLGMRGKDFTYRLLLSALIKSKNKHHADNLIRDYDIIL